MPNWVGNVSVTSVYSVWDPDDSLNGQQYDRHTRHTYTTDSRTSVQCYVAVECFVMYLVNIHTGSSCRQVPVYQFIAPRRCLKHMMWNDTAP
jgi:hypothetical protein